MITTDNQLEARAFQGPSLLALSIVYGALSLGSVALMASATSPVFVFAPFDGTSTVVVIANHLGKLRLGAFLHFGAAIVLGIVASVASSRLRSFGVRAAGVSIAFFGGAAAATFAALAALLEWALVAVETPAPLATGNFLHFLIFALGGVGHIAMLGLLVAGLSIAGGLSRVLARWLVAFGVTLAVTCELASLTIALPATTYLIPVAELSSLIWLIGVGAAWRNSRSLQDVVAAAAPPTRFNEAHRAS
jgi:hypothetical protein